MRSLSPDVMSIVEVRLLKWRQYAKWLEFVCGYQMVPVLSSLSLLTCVTLNYILLQCPFIILETNDGNAVLESLLLMPSSVQWIQTQPLLCAIHLKSYCTPK